MNRRLNERVSVDLIYSTRKKKAVIALQVITAFLVYGL